MCEAVLALLTVLALGPVLALTLEHLVVQLSGRADVGVAVTHAPTSDADLLDGVVIPGHNIITHDNVSSAPHYYLLVTVLSPWATDIK